MKLMELRGLIRKPGNPTMVVDLGNGVPMTIAFQKTPLLEELGKAFNDERTAETGLSYDPVTCTLSVDGFVGADAGGGAADLQMADDDEFDTEIVTEGPVGTLDEIDDDEPMSPEEISDLDDDDEDDLL